ncbi:hypothetical protein COX21_01965 [Candidatus Falkowbacteria bacterium CG23_combo_of_CG06-09_8_20_14_all_41_10]|uniref:Type 4 fimbrial biogenesis protein PilX N-terminal domain-containing protein n=2 Tax=Candidatus Falkowiibacteriota TaxID=1752728 RepID=A0A2G9ZNE2_9BACT|nr:MAG: hypothetical protein AUJ35_01235 [Candidatus Falkowbacteria bacterium CG1_02_41_21]PIP34621.1 MAG: hypothetical protein COX21_01965 [Candidatus Falkowbacteria bacterium CG23_combo_of_CG06-09_8_20_14_all_41_10]
MTGNINRQPAFVSVISVLILGVVGLSISIYIILFSLASSKNSLSLSQSTQARTLATAGAESALEQIREDPAYTGTTDLTLSEGLCSYMVADTGGETRTISVTATVAAVVRHLSLTVTAINPVITIGFWQEVP